MSLHDDLSDVLDRVDDGGPDLMALAAVARRRGTATRRRRRTAGVVAAAACLALVAPVVAGLGHPGTDLVGGSPASTAPITVVRPDLRGPRVPVTGPAAVEALVWATAQRRTGTASAPLGQDFASTSGDYYAQVRWDDADGLGAAQLAVNVEHFWPGGCGHEPEAKLDCHARRLADGGLLVTYREADRTDHGTGRYTVADLRRADGIRVVVTASNGFQGSGDSWRITRPTPPLSTADLAAVVRAPIWGDRVPGAFARAGRQLRGYVDQTDPGGWRHGSAG